MCYNLPQYSNCQKVHLLTVALPLHGIGIGLIHLGRFEPKTLKFFLDFIVTMWYTVTSVQMICAVSSAG